MAVMIKPRCLMVPPGHDKVVWLIPGLEVWNVVVPPRYLAWIPSGYLPGT
jgi:hypothetical protein